MICFICGVSCCHFLFMCTKSSAAARQDKIFAHALVRPLYLARLDMCEPLMPCLTWQSNALFPLHFLAFASAREVLVTSVCSTNEVFLRMFACSATVVHLNMCRLLHVLSEGKGQKQEIPLNTRIHSITHLVCLSCSQKVHPCCLRAKARSKRCP